MYSHIFRTFLLFFVIVQASLAQTTNQKEKSWEEISKQYEFPSWYTEARFGIWVHWGAQTEPELGGGWYARHMYMPNVGWEQWGKNAYSYHCKTYGHPSEKGFKDVIHEWNAENLNTDELIQYFKGLGAKYFMALANHHDHFDNFNSTYQTWNSVNVGPKRDLIGEFRTSARKFNIPFGVSSHDDRYLDWWLPAFGADSSGPKKDIPYDGNMTKADGIGQWWEGLDPADLYGLPPAKRTPEWIEGVKKNWLLRHNELVIKYDVDMIWFDGWEFPYGDYGKDLCRTFLSQDLEKNGEFKKVVAGKIPGEPAIVKDVERGGTNEIVLIPWQSIITIGDWFYKQDRPLNHNTRTVIEMMADVISKNGNLVLNVELLPDGTIPPEDKPVYDSVGRWVTINSDAIYASKPWKAYGDNLNSVLRQAEKNNISNADLEVLKKQTGNEQFNERTTKSLPYGPDEVRFTTKGNVLYVFVLNPTEGNIELPALGLKSPYTPNKIKSIRMLGSKEKIKFKQDSQKLTLFVPDKRPNKYTSVFEVVGAL